MNKVERLYHQILKDLSISSRFVGQGISTAEHPDLGLQLFNYSGDKTFIMEKEGNAKSRVKQLDRKGSIPLYDVRLWVPEHNLETSISALNHDFSDDNPELTLSHFFYKQFREGLNYKPLSNDGETSYLVEDTIIRSFKGIKRLIYDLHNIRF